MRAPFVKVCGITRDEDARAAVAAGAHAVGFVFVPQSPRAIEPAEASRIGRLLPAAVARVGVVRDLDRGRLETLVREAGLTALQLHGQEPPELLDGLSVPAIKAFAAGPGFDAMRLRPYRGVPVLLDGGHETGRGGTGQSADWETARAARLEGFRVLLAGGLGPRNVAEAARHVEPVALDLNSGVELTPGIKDPRLIAEALRCLTGFDPPEPATWPW